MRIRFRHAAPIAVLVGVVVLFILAAKFELDGTTAPRVIVWGGAALWFLVGVKLRARAWRVLDTPTSKVAAAAVGTCELSGTAIAVQPAIARASGTSCVWFTWELQEWRKSGKSSKWVTVDSTEARHPFVLADDSGEIRVDPASAEFHGFETFTYPVPHRAGKWRQLEWRLPDRAQVYLLGPVRIDASGATLEVGGADHDEFVISDDSEHRVARRFGMWAWVSLLFALTAAVVAPFLAIRDEALGTDSEAAVEVDGNTVLAIAAGGVFVVALAASWLVRVYNRLVMVKNQAEKAWSSIEVHLQRRYDLNRNLVEVVKGYVEHEGSLLTATAVARAQASLPDATELRSTASHDAAAHADAQQLLALAEAYPTLHADQQFERLSDALRDTENRIALSRTFYNDAVNVMRDRRGTFPYVLVAPFVTMPSLDLFQASEREAVAVGI